MLFEYVAVAENGIEQKGRIEALSIDDAKKKLNAMRLSILTVQEFQNEKIQEEGIKKSQLKVFAFSGIDQENQEVEGTIEAENELIAYKRLVEEFALKLQWLVNDSLKPVLKEAKKKKSIQEIEDLAYERGIEIHPPHKEIKKKEVSDESLLDVRFQKQQHDLQKKIGEVIQILSSLFEEIKNINPATATSLEERSEELAKIKMSNNLTFIESSADKLVSDVLSFFESHQDKKQEYKKELIHLESLLAHATQAKVQKAAQDVYELASNTYSSLLNTLNLKKNDESLDEHQEVLKKLKAERNEIIRLLAYHFWGIIIRAGELRKKHKAAFVKLFHQLKKLSKVIRNIQNALQNIKNFDKKDFSNFVQEVHYFSAWLFTVYFIFLSIAEISFVKSRIVSPDIVWKILQSEFVITITFTLFVLLFISPYIKSFLSRNILAIFFSYLGVFLISLLFYFNY